jgi:hypothetical protein
LSRERKGKGKKKGEIKGTGNGEARVEDFLEQRPGSPPARSPSMSPTPSNHPFPLMATPTSSSPPVTTNFQLVLSDDNESSGYFTLKPASPSIDKKLSMECQVIVEKLPPCLATGKGTRTGTKTENCHHHPQAKVEEPEQKLKNCHHHPEAKVEEPEQKLKTKLVLKFLL